MSINDYTSEFERQLKLKNNSASTIATYTGILRCFLFYHKKDPKAITVRMMKDNLHRGQWDFEKLRDFGNDFLLDVGAG